jgi:hypothetical protein
MSNVCLSLHCGQSLAYSFESDRDLIKENPFTLKCARDYAPLMIYLDIDVHPSLSLIMKDKQSTDAHKHHTPPKQSYVDIPPMGVVPVTVSVSLLPEQVTNSCSRLECPLYLPVVPAAGSIWIPTRASLYW